MVRVIGRSGIELELDESTAASLVKQGIGTYADVESTPDSADELDPGGAVQQPGQAIVGDGDEPETVEPTVSDVEAPPAAGAPKAAWVEYATRVHGARFSEASKLTKDELIARYGQPAGAEESEEDKP